MNTKYIILSFAIIGLCLLTSCKDDSSAANATTSEATTESHAGHDHSGHDHSGHDHTGHDHSGHDHGDATSNANTGDTKIVNVPSTPKEKQKAIAQSEADRLMNANKSAGKIDISKTGIANPCKLITTDWLKKNTSLKVSEPRFKKGSGIINQDNRSCFVQWEQDGDPNVGFLINVMVNPIPDEITDFPQTYMEAKKRDGETMVGNDRAFPYKKIEGLGLEGLGCYELGKYYFRQDNEFLFMLAFNMDVSKDQQFKAAKQLGNEILKNYYAAIAAK